MRELVRAYGSVRVSQDEDSGFTDLREGGNTIAIKEKAWCAEFSNTHFAKNVDYTFEKETHCPEVVTKSIFRNEIPAL